MTTYLATGRPPAVTTPARAARCHLEACREWIDAAEASGNLEDLAAARRIHADMTGADPVATDADRAAFRAFCDA